ncbi:MAG TPA: hypothetical protein VHP33_00400 [Polyangiaceae bacterium]|nr:hypothetical protein [Polyangiaceae bacterium]
MTLRILRAVSDMALRTEAGLRRCYSTLRRLGRRTSQHDHAAAELIAESELFDGDWYLAHYPEAARSGMQTALHYVCVGAAQGNDPGPSFSSSGYLARYPDVGAAGMNPLLHYLRFGSEEGRDIVAPGTSKRAAPTAVGPWDVPCEAPLAAPSPVRFSLEPWLAEPDGAARLPPDAQLDGIALSLSGVSLGFVGPGARRERKVVAAFARLSGVDVTEALVVGDENAPGPEANSGTPGLDTMLSLGSATGFDFGDVWFINDRDLRARLNAPPGCVQRLVLSCYQFAPAMLPTQRPATQRRLLRLAEQAAPRGELDFADIATSNPYLPLLFTLTTAGGAMIAATLLPFPSLCRGGAHYGELLSASHGKDYLTALRAESHLLVEERLSDAGPPALARIEVDLRDATGAERIFSADLRSWIGQEGAGVTIAPAAPAHGSEGLAVRYLEESVTTPALAEPSATRPFTLRLPADAIPSLRVLVSRRLPWPHDGEQMVGAFVVVAQADGAPRWCIMPPAHADLVALQPEGGSGFPILLGSGSALRAPAADQRAAYPEPLLLALRFCDLSQPQTSRLVAPVAPEAPGPLLPAAGGDQRSQLSVLHHVSGSLAHLEAFLESLQRQRIAATPEVILVLADDRSDHAAIADDLVRRYFPKTGRLVRDPEPADRAERLEAAAATARGDFLLFVGDDVILHDARTLVTLLTLAHYERAASASCLMIATDPRQPMRMMLVSGGYYRHEVCSGSDATSINLDVCADLAALPPATWPVAASDPRISMVRGDIWRKLKGFSAAGQQADLDDGARAAMAGYSHYCTSVISVTLLGDVAGSSAMAAPPLSPGTRTGTVVRRLVA